MRRKYCFLFLVGSLAGPNQALFLLEKDLKPRSAPDISPVNWGRDGSNEGARGAKFQGESVS